MRFWFLFLFIASISFADGPATQPKASVPLPDDQQAATKRIEELFRDDITRAKSPDDKAALCRKFISTAIDEKHDSPGRLALLFLATNLAADAGDLGGACRAIDEMERLYNIDAMKMRADAASRTFKILKTPEEKKRFAPAVSDLLTQALDVDRFDAAKQLNDVQSAIAMTLDDAAMKTQAKNQRALIKESESAFPAFRKALAVLEENPTDADANLLAGKYHCYLKGDWDDGLGMLALGSDAKLRRLAQTELKSSLDSNMQLTVADGWFELASKESDVVKEQILQHAGKWYRSALPELSGLHKAQAEQRLASIAPPPTTPAPTTPVQRTPGLATPATRPTAAAPTKIPDPPKGVPAGGGGGGGAHPADAVQSKSGRWFKLISTQVNWGEAKAECEKLGGHLACIESAEDQDVVSKIISDSNHRWAWLGGSTPAPKGKYTWINGKPLQYTNWAKGEPNGKSGKETVIYIGKSSSNWFDASAERDMPFICQWDK